MSPSERITIKNKKELDDHMQKIVDNIMSGIADDLLSIPDCEEVDSEEDHGDR